MVAFQHYWSLLLLLFKSIVSQHHGATQMGKNPQEGSCPTSSQSRVNYESRPECSGLYPLRSGKPPRAQTAQPLWAASSHAWLPLWCFLISSQSFQVLSVFSCALATHCCENPGSVSSKTSLQALERKMLCESRISSLEGYTLCKARSALHIYVFPIFSPLHKVLIEHYLLVVSQHADPARYINTGSAASMCM